MGVSPGRPINPYTGQVGGYAYPGSGAGYPGHVPFRVVPGTVDTGNTETNCQHCRPSAIKWNNSQTTPYNSSAGTCYNGCNPHQQQTYQNSDIYATGYQNSQIQPHSYTYQQFGNAGIHSSGFSMSGATGYPPPLAPSAPAFASPPLTYMDQSGSYDDAPPPYQDLPELEKKVSGYNM
ncbi:uncharacterized protein LOC128216768 [Mya arenaria]|nr:uncharacterized protein LOC128216768 [Mya arenaria]